FCVKACQLPIVVQHFLKVGHMPFGIHGISGKSTTHMIINSTKGHSGKGSVDKLQNFLIVSGNGIVEQKIPVVGHHELWGPLVSTQKSVKILRPIMDSSTQLFQRIMILILGWFH